VRNAKFGALGVDNQEVPGWENDIKQVRNTRYIIFQAPKNLFPSPETWDLVGNRKKTKFYEI